VPLPQPVDAARGDQRGSLHRLADPAADSRAGKHAILVPEREHHHHQRELAQLQPTGDLLHDRHHQRHHQREYNIHRLLPVILFVRWHTADPLLRHRRGVSFTNSGSGSFTGYVFAPSGQVSMTVSGNNDTGFIEASSVALTNSGSTTVTGPTPTGGTKLIG
jgi:hypothetical protein